MQPDTVVLHDVSGGTVYFDEVADLPNELQAKLLRLVEEGVFQRLGDWEENRTDVRIVAATAKDLDSFVAQGSFRGDLYYRLDVLRIDLPPLRERLRDIEVIAQTYLTSVAREQGAHEPRFSSEALSALMSHKWPGNLRELEGRIRRAVATIRGEIIGAKDLGFTSGRTGGRIFPTLAATREAAEINAIREALGHFKGNVSRAALELDVSRPTLHHLMNKHGIHAEDYR